MTLRRIVLIGWFFLCLYPVSVDGIGVNYAFVLLPLISVVLLGRLRHPGSAFMLVIVAFVAIFFCAALYQYDLIDESGRRFVSFGIFMSIFSYMFVRVDDEMIAAFKIAVVVSSAYFSLISIYVLLSAGPANVGYAAKDLVGTQRIGFVYVLALWLAYIDREVKKTFGIARHGLILVVTAGLLLTFSRASVVSALGSLGLFVMSRTGRWITSLSLRGLLKAVVSVSGAAIIVGILYDVFPLTFSFFGERLFDFLSSSEDLQAHLLDPNSSEGTRLLLLQDITEFVSRNPVTGAGYLGVWVLPHAPTGSAHNQYLDVLFRTGIPGLLAYGFLLVTLMRRLWREEEGLFWGVTGILIYGLFHETFKESHGAGILAFLLGLLAQGYRDARERFSGPRATLEANRLDLQAPGGKQATVQ